MGIGTRIIKNTTYLTVGDKVGYMLQFVFFLFFAKKFGVVPTGEYSFGYYFSYTFIVCANLGISVYLVREVARDYTQGRGLFFDCLVLRLFSLILTSIVAYIILRLFFSEISPQKYNVIVCWGIHWFFYGLADVFISELNGREKMGLVALMGIGLRLFITVSGLALIYMAQDYDKVMIVFPISGFLYFCGCAATSHFAVGRIEIKFKGIAHYRNLMLELLPFLGSFIMVEFLFFIDFLFLGFMKGDQPMGVYSSALKIVSFILGVSGFIHISILPVFSRLFVESKKKLIEVSNESIRFVLIALLPVCFGLTFTADKIIDLLYSNEFHEAGLILQVSSWTIVLGFTQSIFSAILTSINRQKEKVLFIGINFILSIILHLVLIYHYSAVGAAVAHLLTSLIGLVLFACLTSRYLASLSIFSFLIKPCVACVGMSIFVYFLHHWSLLYLIPMAATVYCIILLLIGTFSIKEMALAREMIFKKLSIR